MWNHRLAETSAGHFVPDELRSSLTREIATWDQLTRPDAAVMRHEFNHYLNTVGTTFGTFVFATWRSQVRLAFNALKDTIWPHARAELGYLPVPLFRFFRKNSDHSLTRKARESLAQYFYYDTLNRFEMGDVPTAKFAAADGSFAKVALPTLQIDKKISYRFGARDLLENAAWLEDRVIYNDFEGARFKYDSTYDFLWKWCAAVGIGHPVMVLSLIDIAFNPKVIFKPGDSMPPLTHRLASYRFEWLTRIAYSLQREGRLPRPPQCIGEVPRREALDQFYSEFVSIICSAAGFSQPVDAIDHHLNRIDQLAYPLTIRPVFERSRAERLAHPSAFILPFGAKPSNPVAQEFPPLLVTAGPRGASTIKDPLIGAVENQYLIIKSVVNQLVLGTRRKGYYCPMCKLLIKAHATDHMCQWTTKLWKGIVPFDLPDLRWI